MLRIYRGADGDYTLYEDDGVSQEYLKRRASWIRMRWDDRARRLTLEPGAPSGATNVARERVFSILVLPEETRREMRFTGARVERKF